MDELQERQEEYGHFIDDDGSQYWEDAGIVVKRWPRRMVESETTPECFCDG